MKRILFAIIVSLFFFENISYADEIKYSSEEGNYSFTVPSDWVEIPQALIDANFAFVDEGGPEFLAGFQLGEDPTFEYPYLLVQEHDEGGPTYDQVVEAFEDENLEEGVEQAAEEYSQFLSSASFDTPFIDKERAIIFLNFELEVLGVGDVRGLSAIFLGRNNISQLNFYSESENFSENVEIFNKIIDSFEYDPGYEYDEKEAEKNSSSDIFDGVWINAFFGGVGGGLAALTLALYFRRKKNKSQEKSLKRD